MACHLSLFPSNQVALIPSLKRRICRVVAGKGNRRNPNCSRGGLICQWTGSGKRFSQWRYQVSVPISTAPIQSARLSEISDEGEALALKTEIVRKPLTGRTLVGWRLRRFRIEDRHQIPRKQAHGTITLKGSCQVDTPANPFRAANTARTVARSKFNKIAETTPAT